MKYHGGVANNGRFLLHGRETWYYENGTVQYEVEYQLGEKIGREIYRSFDAKISGSGFIKITVIPNGNNGGQMVKIRQNLEINSLEDPAKAVIEGMKKKLSPALFKGKSVAVTSGSRSIAGLPLITKSIIIRLKE